jgi:hypothetical protein
VRKALLGLVVAFILLTGRVSFAQYTTVTATAGIKDKNSNAYTGSYSVTFIKDSGDPANSRLNGNTFTQSFTGTLTSGGAFPSSLSLASNPAVTPGISHWRFFICAGNGFPCFTDDLTISGASQDVSTALSAVAPNVNSGYIPGTIVQNTAGINNQHGPNQPGVYAVSAGGQYYPLIAATDTTGKGVAITPSGIVFPDASLQTSASSGGGSPGGSPYDLQYYSTSSSFGGITAPSSNGYYSCGYQVTGSAAVAPTCTQLGLSPRAASGSSDTIAYTDVLGQVNAVASESLPTPTTLTNSQFQTTIYCPLVTGCLITPVTWTIAANGGTALANLQLYYDDSAFIFVDPTNSQQWDALVTKSALPDDPTEVTIDEDFEGGGFSASGGFGTYGWNFGDIGAAGTIANTAGAIPNLGQITITTHAVATDEEYISLSPQAFGALGNTALFWQADFIFELNGTSTSLSEEARVGFGEVFTSAVPTAGFYICEDPTNGCGGAGNTSHAYFCSDVATGTETCYDLGATLTNNSFYRLRINNLKAGVPTAAYLNFQLFGSTGASVYGPYTICASGCTATATPTTAAVTPFFAVVSATATTAEVMTADAFKFKMRGLSR